MISLKFGKKYITRLGRLVEIVEVKQTKSGIEFFGSSRQTYTEDGRSTTDDIIAEATEKDIIKLELLESLKSSPRYAFEALRIWGENVFGPVVPSRIVERAQEEMNELHDKLKENDEWTPESLEEAADIVVILTRAPGLWEAVERKTAINCDRDWNLKGDGTGYHIPKENKDISSLIYDAAGQPCTILR